MVKLLCMDVDGTLTDGKIYMGENGELMKAFDIKDGCGIHDLLPKYAIHPVIITARQSKILENRCRELGITSLYQGCRNKKDKLKELAVDFGLVPGADGRYPEIAYIGDDILDLQCFELAGSTGCPADAVQEVKDRADFISRRDGGNGAVREFIEWLIRHESD